MECSNCQSYERMHHKDFANQPQPGTVKIWTPSWVTAYEGPKFFCEHHAVLFKNCDKPNSQFLYEEEADTAFNLVETFIKKSDERYENAKGMIENANLAKIIFGEHIRLFHSVLSVVDGKVWLGTYYHICRLGNYADVKPLYPNYFKNV